MTAMAAYVLLPHVDERDADQAQPYQRKRKRMITAAVAEKRKQTDSFEFFLSVSKKFSFIFSSLSKKFRKVYKSAKKGKFTNVYIFYSFHRKHR